MRTHEGEFRILRDTWIMPGEEILGCYCANFKQWVIGIHDGGALICTSHHPDCDIPTVDERDLLDDHDHWSHVSDGSDGFPAYAPRNDWLDRYLRPYGEVS